MDDANVTLTISDERHVAQLSVTDRSDEVMLSVIDEPTLVTLSVSAGGSVAISSDPNNRLEHGNDSGLYVRDDLVPDPLAYYILAKG